MDEFCWICFEGDRHEDPLTRVCRCNTMVHRRCIARWQLYSAGKIEEKSCRFCSHQLPDWRPILTPKNLAPAVPVLSIYYNGACHKLKVKVGPEGLNTFIKRLEELTGTSVSDVNFTFRCRCPDTGREIYLKGFDAFEAAMHCACVRAAQRATQPKSTKVTSVNNAA